MMASEIERPISNTALSQIATPLAQPLTNESSGKEVNHKMLCSVCYREVINGVIVPGFQQAAGVCHEDCIAEAVLKIAEDPSKEGLLRHLVEYEENRAPQDWARDISGGSADVCWEWTAVNIPYCRIRPLLDAGLVAIVFRTNRSTNYALVGRQIIKEALRSVNGLRKNTPNVSRFPWTCLAASSATKI